MVLNPADTESHLSLNYVIQEHKYFYNRTILNLQYGYILRDDTMIQVNMFGLALNIIYVMIYFNYSQQKVKVWAQIGLAGAVSAALIGYAQTEDPKLVETRFGTIITAFMFYLIASPLFGLVSFAFFFSQKQK